ncbi:MAG: hypothetical protein QE271_01525 [Bacteriovoracaceae bacterium]|nr:hypothetical protein [Bacteriovoracaceae bacterium]
MKSMPNKKKRKQKGQTIIEFILLLATLVGISFFFYATFGKQMSSLWLRIANQIYDNPNKKLEIE